MTSRTHPDVEGLIFSKKGIIKEMIDSSTKDIYQDFWLGVLYVIDINNDEIRYIKYVIDNVVERKGMRDIDVWLIRRILLRNWRRLIVLFIEDKFFGYLSSLEDDNNDNSDNSDNGDNNENEEKIL